MRSKKSKNKDFYIRTGKGKLFWGLLICMLLIGCQKAAAQEDIVQTAFGNMGTEFFSENELTVPCTELDETLLEKMKEPELSYAKEYYEFLKRYSENNSSVESGRIRFCMAFMDDDEIPELLIIDDNIHAEGVKVYTYYSDDIVFIGEYGSMGTMQYVEGEGLICSSFTGMGEHMAGYYQMEDGEAVCICKLHSYPNYTQDDPYSHLLYEIDEISVSKEEYHAKYEVLKGDHEFISVGYDNGIPINIDNLETLLQAVIANIELKRGSLTLQEKIEEQAKVLEAYEGFLDDYAKDWRDYEGEDDPVFSLIYLNEDAIPELVIFDDVVHASCAKIYTYEDEETVHIGDYGQYGGISYAEGEGIIFSDYDFGGNLYSTIYQIDGTEETVLQDFSQYVESYSEIEGDIYTYEVDGKEVSEEQYNTAYSVWDEYDSEKIITYDICTSILDGDLNKALIEELENLILGQETALWSKLMANSGAAEDEILRFDYDDFDYDGNYEAFAFCGIYEEYETENLYIGSLWFVGTDSCVKLTEGNYRMIDGKINMGRNQKYIYLNNDMIITANESEIWTVENGEPVESPLSCLGEVSYNGGNSFEIWTNGYDHFYEPEKDLWTGHTYKPNFYAYNWSTDKIEQYEGETISRLQLKKLCGFDLTAEIEAEGYEVTTILKWGNGIITVNYTIPPEADDTYQIIEYDNVIWDCNTDDYWRKDERDVTSWRNAGVGGTFQQ